MTREELENLLDYVHEGGGCEDRGFEDTSTDERVEIIEEFKRLQADNARLKALIKEAERTPYEHACPWCWAETEHAHDCPAFTPEGEVK